MNVVVFPVELHQARLEVCADLGEWRAQVLQDVFGEDFASILGDKDQVDMHQKEAVSRVARNCESYGESPLKLSS